MEGSDELDPEKCGDQRCYLDLLIEDAEPTTCKIHHTYNKKVSTKLWIRNNLNMVTTTLS